jgi:hypothetical protein
MARTVTGKLKQDIRINHEGKEDGAGRLYLKGEFATVDEDLADKVDARAKKPVRRRTPYPFADKQVTSSETKSLKGQVDTLQKENAELKARLSGGKTA